MARTGGLERRVEFVKTAQQLFYTNGYERTSINDIINAIGVSKGAFYHHFDSKDAVLVEVVNAVVAQTAVLLEPILNDDTLTAIEKFNLMTHTVGHWKNDRREEMVALVRMMYSNENLPLRSRLTRESNKIMTPLLARIVEQGVAEGAFELGGVQASDAVEYVVAIMRTAGEAAIELLLDPERPMDAAEIAAHKYQVAEKMICRILGASDGLLLVNYEIFRSWFEPDKRQPAIN